MKKRILSIILAVIMIVGMLPLSAVTAFAAEEEPALEFLDCLDVGEGAYINTNYKPKSNTRVVFDAEVVDDAAVLFGVDFPVNNVGVSFYVNAGYYENAYEGSTFGAPIEPMDSSFKFEGWYKDRNFTEKWNFATEIVGDTDITLYAKWVAKQ